MHGQKTSKEKTHFSRFPSVRNQTLKIFPSSKLLLHVIHADVPIQIHKNYPPSFKSHQMIIFPNTVDHQAVNKNTASLVQAASWNHSNVSLS